MKICAVICELNPLHNGHEYLFREARRLTGADYLVAVMSGDFVQRGVPAICDKYARTSQALMAGADVVCELPAVFATASADYFAQGAVSAIVSLGCVSHICFGSECGDIDLLLSCAGLHEEKDPGLHILSYETDAVRSRNYRITKLLKEGMSYAKAYATVTGNEFASNDMLAVRYIKSLRLLDSDIEPVCIKRTGGNHNDLGESDFSAANVRRKIAVCENFAHLVPKYVYRNLQSISQKAFPVRTADFSIQLYTTLSHIINREEEFQEEYLTDYMDVSANIAGRIRANIGRYTGYEEFIGLVHSKEYTKSRIYRALLHILLDIRKADYPDELSDCQTGYIRILGFRQSSSPVLSRIKDTCMIPVISKAGDASSILDDEAMYIFGKDIKAANLYDMATVFKFGEEPVHDFSREVVII